MKLPMTAQREKYVQKLQALLGNNITTQSAEIKVNQLLMFLMGEEGVNLTYVRNGMEMLLTASADLQSKYQDLLSKADIRNEKKEKGKLETEIMSLNREIESKRTKIRELNAESNRLSKEISEKKDEVDDLKSDIDDLQDTVDDLKGEIQNMRNAVKAEEKKIQNSTVKTEGAPTKDYQTKINTLNSRIDTLTNEKEKLIVDNQQLKDIVKKYHSADRFFIDTIQRTYQARYSKGKAITLRQDEIEKVFRTYIKLQATSKTEPTRYRIAKETNVGHKTVDALLNMKYTNVNSLRKIVAALHAVNGNWSEGNKALLERYISDYEELKRVAEEKDKVQRAQIKSAMGSLPEAHEKYLEHISSEKSLILEI